VSTRETVGIEKPVALATSSNFMLIEKTAW
jgi:hypothetical protein